MSPCSSGLLIDGFLCLFCKSLLALQRILRAIRSPGPEMWIHPNEMTIMKGVYIQDTLNALQEGSCDAVEWGGGAKKMCIYEACT
jgi:hypothetical protein